MSPSEYQYLVEFLAKKFDRIDERFDRVDERFARVDERFDRVDERFDRVDERFDGVDERFDGVDGRLEGLEQRMVRVEVGQESLRTDIQTTAELVTANGRRIDENRRAIESLSEKMDLNTVGIRAVRDRVASLEDHLRAV